MRRCLPLADEEQMVRFGQRGKNEEVQPEALAGIRMQLGPRSLVLVGMPGSGKSAVGRRLATRLDLPFVDADEEIERAAGKPITDIFKDHGEPYFREGERKVIARLLSGGPQVLATGGGALMSAETRENIRRSGISIWLKAELTVLMRRVLKRNNRPLLENDPERVMRELMEARYPIYATAERDHEIAALEAHLEQALREARQHREALGPLTRRHHLSLGAKAGGSQASLEARELTGGCHVGIRDDAAPGAAQPGLDEPACRIDQAGSDQHLVGAAAKRHGDGRNSILRCHGGWTLQLRASTRRSRMPRV